jgi:hypothetical protein
MRYNKQITKLVLTIDIVSVRGIYYSFTKCPSTLEFSFRHKSNEEDLVASYNSDNLLTVPPNPSWFTILSPAHDVERS